MEVAAALGSPSDGGGDDDDDDKDGPGDEGECGGCVADDCVEEECCNTNCNVECEYEI